MTNATSTQSAAAGASDSLAGKIAVITGAARGIGHQIARADAAHAATVVLSDVNESAVGAAASTVPGSTAIRCDVRDQQSIAELFDRAVNEYGKVDVAVANAGIATVSPLLEMSFDTWRTMMSINLDVVFLTLQHAARAMIATQTAGSIITMASVTALAGVPLVGHYAAAKAGVVSLTKTAALELRSTGIRVNAVLPGFAETELVTANREQYGATAGLDFDSVIRQGQGGYVSVDDIASLALFLATERSKFCTSGAFVVDGGLTASLL
jgi:NAD(P)-dependent dehydrogenase (short-subunit alcohol dehydrogenase family)